MKRLAVVLFLVMAAPAQAANVRVRLNIYSDIREDVSEAIVTYTAAPGERNHLRLRSAPHGRVRVSDRVRVNAGPHCRSLNRHAALCRVPAEDLIVVARLGDRADAYRGFGPAFAGYADVRIYGGAGDDRLRASTVGDRLRGGRGRDTLLGGRHGDLLRGDGGRDVLRGGPGRDDLAGGPGHDDVAGGEDNDRLGGGPAAADRLRGGAGRDVLGFSGVEHGVRAALGSPVTVNGHRVDAAGFERLSGGPGPDVLRGDGAPNGLFGGGGADRLFGGGGADVLDGDDGNDRIVGGTGADTLDAGAGRNVLHGGPGPDTLEAVSYLSDVTDGHCGPGRDRVYTGDSSAAALFREDCELFAFQRQRVNPVATDARSVTMHLRCARQPRPIRLVTPPPRPWFRHGRHGAVVATGVTGIGPRSRSCDTRLALTAFGRRVARPVPVRVISAISVGWTFRLQ